MDELKKLEAKLSQATHAKNKFLTIIESLPNPVILTDEQNRFEYMNQAADKLFENNPSCSTNFYHHADDGSNMRSAGSQAGSVESCLPWLDSELADFAAGPELTSSFEKTLPAQGCNRNFDIRFSRIRDADGGFWSTLIILEDITEKKLAEKALRLSEERFRSIFESATDSIVVWDKDYNYLYANQAAIENIGITRHKANGQNIRDTLDHLPDLMRLWMDRVDRVFESGQAMRVEDAVEVGTRFVFSESIISPIKDTRGNMFAVGVLYRDVTERKEMENQLRRQNVALEQSNQELERANHQIIEQQKTIIEEERLKVLLQMAGATAHELNQP